MSPVFRRKHILIKFYEILKFYKSELLIFYLNITLMLYLM